MVLLYVVVFVLFISFAAIGAAFYTMSINRKKALELQDAIVENEVIDYDEEQTHFFLDDAFEEKRTLLFYGEIQELSMRIPANESIYVALEEVYCVISSFVEVRSDSFFGIEINGQVIQFSYSGSGSIAVDMPVAIENGSYVGEVSNSEELKVVVNLFTEGKDLISYLEFESW